MKKLYTLTLAFSFSEAMIYGHDTIRMDDFASIGDTIRLVDDFTVTGLAPGPAGANQTWNFSNLGVDYLDTLAVLDPANTPNGSSIPSANLAIKLNDGYTYLDVNTNSASIVGLGGDILGLGVSVEIPFANPLENIEFPSMYQHTTQDTSHFVLSGDPAAFGLTNLPIQIDSIKVVSNTYAADSVDGWGELITVTDTFDCIRRFRSEYRIDSIFMIAPLLGSGWQLVPTAFMSGFPPPYNNSNPTIIEDYKFEWLAKGADYVAMAIYTDANGFNPTRATYIVGEKLLAIMQSANDITCNGGSDGSATVENIYGTPPFTYLWDDANAQVTPTATGLTAGTYNVTITDALGDEGVANVTLAEPTAIVITTSVTDASCATCTDGAYSAAAGGGSGGYGYSWSSGETSSVVSNVAPGTYIVTVTDGTGCSSTSSVTIGSWPLSIADAKDQSGIVIYPNPSNGLITLEANESRVINYQVVNMLGELIESKQLTLNMGQNQIDLGLVNGGLYFLNIFEEGELLKSRKLTVLK
jgi:hypothetical protein